jgi:alpha-D-xyloside xylohydrolase
MITLALNAVVPLDFFLGMNRAIQVLASCLLVFAPLFFYGVMIHPASAQTQKLAPAEKLPNGIVVRVIDGFLKLEVCTDTVIHVTFSKDLAFSARQSLVAAPKQCEATPWTLINDPREALLSTAKLKIKVDLRTSVLSFFDLNGRPIAMETPDGRTLTPAEVQGEKTFHVRQQWQAEPNEALYGFGQHQLGLMNIKGFDLDLWQRNTTVVVPFLVSSRGYGILWDNTSWTRFGDLREFEFIPAARLFDRNGNAGGLTGSYYAGANFDRLVATRTDARIDITTPDRKEHPHTRIHPALPATGDISIRWEGWLEPEQTGAYLFQTYSNSGIKLWLDGQLVIDHWRQGWLPWKDLARLQLAAKHRYRVKLEWTRDQGEETVQLFWKTPTSSPATSLWSEVGEGIDYYFIYGPEIDQVIGGYRRVTGQAPMMPLWAYGLWQCRQRYETQQQSLDILDGFRSRRIPIDNIVQDWFYWKADQWGSHQFDPQRFPDPVKWIQTIHDKYHAHLMISVWPKFYPETENARAMRARGFLYEPGLAEGEKDWINFVYTYYDAFNPEARALFWSQIERELFRKGVDAWWMDATEPELIHGPELEGTKTHMHPTALGSGSRMLNAYPLVNSQAVYEGQRSAAPNQRVFTLTRSGFAGQQRYAAAVWSGDISSTWTAMRKQIPAGLSFSLSGLPYWTMDSGGFSVPARFSRKDASAADIEEWRELNTRWFQFATFVPLLRVHGEFPYREMWYFGGESHLAFQTMLKFDRLRYRLLPYIYSVAGDVTQAGGSFMRAFVMDFRNDAKAREITDQYMFGPSLMINPVTQYQARTRSVYLPQSAGWYDWWTGKLISGGRRMEAPAPYESMPIFVKAGSIIPVGPELQYTVERPADPITLYIYAGADGAFTLYEDEGVNYNYEHGGFSRIVLHWDDRSHTLTIGARHGSFQGMLTQRTFAIILISKTKPVGFSFTPRADRTVNYDGQELKVPF